MRVRVRARFRVKDNKIDRRARVPDKIVAVATGLWLGLEPEVGGGGRGGEGTLSEAMRRGTCAGAP